MKENIARKDDINAGLKILDDFANLYGNIVGMTIEDYEKIQYAINNILSDYKRVLKENKELKYKYDKALTDVVKATKKEEQLQKENKELKEKWDNDTHKLQNDLDIANVKIIELEEKIEDLKDFRKKFVDITDKELKEADDYFMYKYTFMGDELAQHLNTLLKVANNSVPVQKVKDKIEKLEQEKKKYGNCLITIYENELVNRDIQVLQELIEESEEK